MNTLLEQGVRIFYLSGGQCACTRGKGQIKNRTRLKAWIWIIPARRVQPTAGEGIVLSEARGLSLGSFTNFPHSVRTKSLLHEANEYLNT